MKTRIQVMLLLSSIVLYFNTLFGSNDFVEEVKQIEEEIEAIEPVENLEKSEEIRERLNQFYNDVCNHSADLTTDLMIFTSYLTPNVRTNIDGKRVGLIHKFVFLSFAKCNSV